MAASTWHVAINAIESLFHIKKVRRGPKVVHSPAGVHQRTEEATGSD